MPRMIFVNLPVTDLAKRPSARSVRQCRHVTACLFGEQSRTERVRGRACERPLTPRIIAGGF
jgi:hypothetical protein